MTPWDGKERRQRNTQDHDLLTKIDTNLTNFIKAFEDHLKENKEEFDKHDQRIKNLERVFWCGVGVLFVLEVMMKWLK